MSECVPTASELVVRVATPELFSTPVPSEVVPSKKLIVPVGAPKAEEVGVTVAVKVTGSVKKLGLVSEVKVMVVDMGLTLTAVLLEELPKKF